MKSNFCTNFYRIKTEKEQKLEHTIKTHLFEKRLYEVWKSIRVSNLIYKQNQSINHIIMHYKSINSLDYLTIKIYRRMYVKLKLLLCFCTHDIAARLKKGYRCIFFLEERDWLFKENCYSSLSCYKFWLWAQIQLNFEDRIWKQSKPGKLWLLAIIEEIHILQAFLSLHTSSCNENRIPNMYQHNIPQIW